MNIFENMLPAKEIKRIGNYQISKDEVIELHRLLWETKKGLEQTGCVFDLTRYSQLEVKPWLECLSKKDHEQALMVLAKTMVRDIQSK